jgi:hypothetical protein
MTALLEKPKTTKPERTISEPDLVGPDPLPGQLERCRDVQAAMDRIDDVYAEAKESIELPRAFLDAMRQLFAAVASRPELEWFRGHWLFLEEFCTLAKELQAISVFTRTERWHARGIFRIYERTCSAAHPQHLTNGALDLLAERDRPSRNWKALESAEELKEQNVTVAQCARIWGYYLPGGSPDTKRAQDALKGAIKPPQWKGYEWGGLQRQPNLECVDQVLARFGSVVAEQESRETPRNAVYV